MEAAFLESTRLRRVAAWFLRRVRVLECRESRGVMDGSCLSVPIVRALEPRFPSSAKHHTVLLSPAFGEVLERPFHEMSSCSFP